MSLDFFVQTKCCGISLGSHNITHNLSRMFKEAGVYEILWHGDGVVVGEILPHLEAAQKLMAYCPDHFKSFNSDNGCGTYEGAMDFLGDVIELCKEHPQGVIYCSR